jgi:signal transduction histidine kinase
MVSWLGYLLALALIDQVFYPRPIFPLTFYLVNGVNLLAAWGLILGARERPRWTRVIVPAVIGMLSVVPLVMAYWVLRAVPAHPANDPEARLVRLMPLLLVALILTAWRYRGWHVIGFSLGIAALTLGLQVLLHPARDARLLPPLTLLTIQTVSFLTVGSFINTLMGRLKRQQASLAQANTQLTHYASTLEELTISRERNRMARELHDTLAHTLSGLSVQLETVRAYWEVEPATARRLLEQALASTRDGLQETRRALKALRARPLDDLGLRLAVRRLAESAAERANLHLAFRWPSVAPPLTTPVEQCIYRVAQEAIANVVHHAGARTLRVRLAYDGAQVALTVADDGLGFDPRQAARAGHYGLVGMRERAALVGGELAIESGPGEGTSVRLLIHLRS